MNRGDEQEYWSIFISIGHKYDQPLEVIDDIG